MSSNAGRLLLVLGAAIAVLLLGARLLTPALPTTAAPPGPGWNGDGLSITGSAAPVAAPAQAQPASEPHVSCQFYVQSADMDSAQGTITLRPWSAGDAPAAPAVLAGAYDGAAAAAGTYQFVAGPYLLAAGRYEVTVSASSGVDTRHASFWVDACPAGGPTDTPPAPYQATAPAQATPGATSVAGASATPNGTVPPTDTVVQL